jgi:hypothetical protein
MSANRRRPNLQGGGGLSWNLSKSGFLARSRGSIKNKIGDDGTRFFSARITALKGASQPGRFSKTASRGFFVAKFNKPQNEKNMESPVATIKQNITPGKILAFAVTAIAVFAILDLAGLTQWVLAPVSTFKAWNAQRKASA